MAASAAADALLPVGLLLALSGVFVGPLTGALFSTRSRYAPAHLTAQVFSIDAGLKSGGAAVGAALAGSLSALPPSGQLLAVAACPLVAGLAGGSVLALRARAGARPRDLQV